MIDEGAAKNHLGFDSGTPVGYAAALRCPPIDATICVVLFEVP
jgi:hypothetical protein